MRLDRNNKVLVCKETICGFKGQLGEWHRGQNHKLLSADSFAQCLQPKSVIPLVVETKNRAESCTYIGA